jgi:hypothetical protein
MARTDLWLWQDGSAWIVGARHGDGDGDTWRKTFDRESVAMALIETMMKRNGGRDAWLDLTTLVHDSPWPDGPTSRPRTPG